MTDEAEASPAPQTKRMGLKRRLIRLAVLLAALYLLVGFGLTACQRKLLYMPSKEILETPGDYRVPYEAIHLSTADGETLGAWWIPANQKHANGKTILFCHGNAGSIGHRVFIARLFQRHGYNLLLFDYRGFGSSSGSPSEAGLYLDAEAAWSYCTTTRGIAPKDIIIFGKSLGGGVASHLALHKQPGGLVLDSTFTSVPDRAAELYRVYPIRWMVWDTFDTLERAPAIRCPTLVFHSRDDRIIPPHHGAAIHQALTCRKKLVTTSAGHNRTLSTCSETYLAAMQAFFLQGPTPSAEELERSPSDERAPESQPPAP